MALNDPQWGNRNAGGPPDLEEMLRNLNRKIAALLGGRKGGTPGGGSGGAPGVPGGGIAMIVVIALLVWGGSGFYMVNAKDGQRGVVLRFGKYLETTLPGWHYHLPFPIDMVEYVNLTQVRMTEVGYRGNRNNKILQESLMLTDDENIIDIQFAVQYLLKDAPDFLFNNRAPEENVRQAAETAIREVVGKNKMDFVLFGGRGEVEGEIAKLMQNILDRYKSGIMISKVNMQNAQAPEQVKAAFDDAVKAGQDRERQKNEGQAYALDVVPRAKGQAARLIQEAEGYKQAIIANAEGDASRFRLVLAAYEKAPQVTRERMYLEMMQQVFSSTTKVLVDQQKGGNSLLYLPLDKLIQATNPPAAPSAAQPSGKPADQSAAPKNSPESDAAALRSRDVMISRERGERP